ncbi:MAG: hypothetical protein WC955_12340 [Elusimicrobiota bacterium]
MRKSVLPVLLLLLSTASTGYPQPGTAGIPVIEKVKANFGNIQTLKMKVEKLSYGIDNALAHKTEQTYIYAKPDKHKRVVQGKIDVVIGKKTYRILPSGKWKVENEKNSKSLPSLSGLPQFIFNLPEYLNQYDTSVDNKSGNTVVITAIPKNGKSQYPQVMVSVDSGKGVVGSVEIYNMHGKLSEKYTVEYFSEPKNTVLFPKKIKEEIFTPAGKSVTETVISGLEINAGNLETEFVPVITK